MPLPVHRCRPEPAIVKTVGAPICHCEEANGQRGALSAKREEVPLGCNLGQAVTFFAEAHLLSNMVLRDCHGRKAPSQ